MPAARARHLAAAPLAAAVLAGAALLAAVSWHLQMEHAAAQIRTTREALKKLSLTAGVAPSRSVMDYLTRRQAAFEQRHAQVREALEPPPLPPAAQADPQLFFQQRLHEMTQALERLAAARGIPVPQTLGFPKELPPSEAVPRLLIQLQLLQEAAALMVDQEVALLSSLKIDDPEPVRAGSAARAAALVQLPVRVRVQATLPQLMKIVAAADRAAPLIDLQELRIVQAGAQDEALLDAEFVMVRYVAAPPTAEPPAPEGAEAVSRRRAPRARRARGAP